MSVREYIGARYVPILGRKGEESAIWDNSEPYEPLTIVLHNGNSYTSRQFVPAGIEITNNEFWALTGNYNAQVEAYRQEAQRAVQISEDASEVANEANDNANVANSKADIIAANAGVSSSEQAEKSLATLIFENASTIAENTSAIAENTSSIAENTNAIAENTANINENAAHIENNQESIVDIYNRLNSASDISNMLDNIYLGRYVYADDATYKAPQGSCLIDDETLVMFLTNSINTNNVKCIYVNLATRQVMREYVRPFGHANGACFNPVNNKIYVCPNIDYSISPTTTVNYFYICNRDNLTVEQTVQMPFEPHSFAYDKITGEMYMTVENIDPFYIDLYKFDYSDNTYERIGRINRSFPVGTSPLNLTAGTQTVGAYNGNIWYLQGGEGYNILFNLDINETEGDYIKCKGIYSINPDSFMYSVREVEGFDFTSYGDIVLTSKAACAHMSDIQLISGLNMYGNKIVFPSTTAKNRFQYNNYVKTSNGINSLLFADGSNVYPFMTFAEALSAVTDGYYELVTIPAGETVTWDLGSGEVKMGKRLEIYALANSKLVAASNRYVQTPFFYIHGADNTMFEVTASNFTLVCPAYFEAISVKGNVNSRVYLCVQKGTGDLSQATFTGTAGRGICVSSDTSATYTNFLQPKQS